jgi:flagellin
MALRINYNFESVSAQRNLAANQGVFQRAIEQLSSGMRINKAADDAAGLAVSEKLRRSAMRRIPSRCCRPPRAP